MKFNFLFVLFAFALFSSNAANADSPSYSFVDFTALEYDLDVAGADVEIDGYKLKFSAELGDSLFVTVDRIETDGRLASRHSCRPQKTCQETGSRGGSTFA